ncbi:hypothetical protein EW026_g2392 [Hermanssonia centrifuga]|uniref:Methylosome subunit pICln n=1 Tax=Hermanssonia centrifuga TaxID=98765 RepID=A0A4S4KP56_9APHY|nr:hypothetical protein EW026_g2392 [Hermanssonia centrifuga]
MGSIVLIDNLPKFISPDEHRVLVASTPASFSDIPPVLRHKEEDVSVTFDPAVEGFATEDGASGTLYVIESVLIFMSVTGRGIQVEYPSITLHAISRAESGPSIYCQLAEQATSSEAQQEEDETQEMRELSINPRASISLEPIFEALSLCASLHPDPATASDMDDDDDDAFIDADENGFETFNGDEGDELSEVGRVRSNFFNDNRYAPY